MNNTFKINHIAKNDNAEGAYKVDKPIPSEYENLISVDELPSPPHSHDEIQQLCLLTC